MKKIILILVMVLPISLFAQSKFSIEGNTSSLFIKNDVGFAYGGKVGYQASKQTTVVLGILNANIDSDIINTDYDVNKYYLNAVYRLNSIESSFGIASIMGFSYMDFDDKLDFTDGSGFGFDLGAKAYFKQNENFEYGFNLIATYNSKSPGAIFESGLFFKYNF